MLWSLCTPGGLSRTEPARLRTVSRWVWYLATIVASVVQVQQRSHQSPLPSRIRTAAFGAIVGAIVVVTAYGYLSSSPSMPRSAAPSLRSPSVAQVVGLRRAIAADWSRARSADDVWMDECYTKRRPVVVCAGALHAQIRVLRRLVEDVSSQPLGGTTLAPVVYGRFVPAVGAALAAKRAAASDIAMGDLTRFVHEDGDPAICIQPLNAAIRSGLARRAGSPFLAYPSSPRRDC
jgi:hypothetical protein